MEAAIISRLRARRVQIKLSWAALLNIEPVSSALADPQVLRHHFDHSLNQIFSMLPQPPAETGSAFHCPCGFNPFLAYFRTGEQALLESLVHAHAERPESTPTERWQDVADLQNVIRAVGRSEMGSFGGICVHRGRTCDQCPTRSRSGTDATFAPLSGASALVHPLCS